MNLLILCQAQFGYHSDTWYYSKYLRENHNVSYLGWDYGKERKQLERVEVNSISRKGSKLVRVARYIMGCKKQIERSKPEVVFIKYFQFCFMLKICFPKTKFIFDIRTASVSYSLPKRVAVDWFMKFESLFFKNITIISKGLKERLNYRSAYILPLGAESLSNTRKDFNKIKLIYVGTLTGRRIEDTINGLFQFINESNSRDITYTIIGDGWNDELNNLKALSTKLNLDDVIDFTGFQSHNELPRYFDKCNVGVSYIPQTVFFDNQPPTKTYEYLLSGMAVLATNTSENALTINTSNGILIDSNSSDFCEGLHSINRMISNEKFETDKQRYQKYEWMKIVQDLNNYLNVVSNR